MTAFAQLILSRVYPSALDKSAPYFSSKFQPRDQKQGGPPVGAVHVA
jgi:hypothetical protein